MRPAGGIVRERKRHKKGTKGRLESGRKVNIEKRENRFADIERRDAD